MKQNNLLERNFNFGVDVLKFLRTLPNESEYNIIKYQLGKSSTSVGANYEESQAASSPADFKNKVSISLKEARKSNYWLRVIKELIEIKSVEIEKLIKENAELKNILVSIVIKLNKENSK